LGAVVAELEMMTLADLADDDLPRLQ